MRPERPLKRVQALFPLLLLGGASLAGCEVGLPAGSDPHYELNFDDMSLQPKVKPQREDLFGALANGELLPPPGAVATTEHPYHYAQAEVELAAAELRNPLPHDEAVIAKGQKVFESICIVCHGPEAAGDGKLTKVFPAPPSLMRPVARDYPDGRIFHVVMRGQASMPSYGKQLGPEDIWSVVHYVRALQARLPVAPPAKNDPPPKPAPVEEQRGASPAL